MSGPLLLVFINSIASLVLITGIIIFRYIYPKKKLNFFYLLIFLSLLPLVNIFRSGVYESGDFVLHIYRAISFYQAVHDGQIIPSWAGELNGGYGYPLFIFQYYLPNYIISFFHFLGFSFILSMKLFLSFSYILSGMFFFLWFKHISKNSFAAFTGSIFYLFAPYHLIDQNFRVDAGEIIAFAVIPLFLLSIDKLFVEQRVKHIVFVGLSISVLFLSHPGITLFTAILSIPYVVLLLSIKKTHRIKIILFLLVAVLIGSVLSSFVWLAFLTYTQYTHIEVVIGPGTGPVTFTNLQNLLYAPWRFGLLFQGHQGDFNPIIGYTQLVVLITACIFILRNKTIRKNRIYILFWFCVCLVLVFLITPYSNFIWSTFPFLAYLQFSYRLSFLVVLAVSAIAGFLSMQMKKKYTIFILIITIVYTILNWGNRGILTTIDDSWIIRNLPKSTTQGEGFQAAVPKWWHIYILKNFWPKDTMTKPVEILSGTGQIKQIFRNSVTHKYIVHAKSELLVKENTFYFPGWNVIIDGKGVPIDYQNKKYSGWIVFTIPRGIHGIQVQYADLPYFALAKKISIFCYISIFIYLFFSLFSYIFHKSS